VSSHFLWADLSFACTAVAEARGIHSAWAQLEIHCVEHRTLSDTSLWSWGRGAEVRASFLDYLCAAPHRPSPSTLQLKGTLASVCVCEWPWRDFCAAFPSTVSSQLMAVPGSGLSMNAKIMAHKRSSASWCYSLTEGGATFVPKASVRFNGVTQEKSSSVEQIYMLPLVTCDLVWHVHDREA